MKNILYWGFIALQILLAALSIFFWWRGGMWAQGEMPTHGLRHVLTGAGLSLGLLALAGLMRIRHREN